MDEARQGKLDVGLKRGACPYCKEDVRPTDEKVACDGCMAWHHADCWVDHGACSACGAARPSGLDSATPVPALPTVCVHEDCTRRPLARDAYKRVLYAGGYRCKQHSLDYYRPRARIWSLLFGLGVLLVVAVAAVALATDDADVLGWGLIPLLFASFWSVGAIGGQLELMRLQALPEPSDDEKHPPKEA
jgi:hypothetical protein